MTTKKKSRRELLELMTRFLSEAEQTWRSLPRAERTALMTGVGSASALSRLVTAGVWADGKRTPWGEFVRSYNVGEFDPARWAVGSDGVLRMLPEVTR